MVAGLAPGAATRKDGAGTWLRGFCVRIGYLVNTYPRGSQTFIRREIRALEALGLPVDRFALRSDRAALTDPEDTAEDRRTEHLLEEGSRILIASALGWMARHPRAALNALLLAMACGWRGMGGGVAGTGGPLRHLIYLAEAAHLARRCADRGVTHLHAHFGTNSATVAMLCAELGGPRWSFTVHGPEEFDAPVALALQAKIARAAFVVAVSSYGRAQLCRWAEPADWRRIVVVPCGILPADWPKPLPAPGGGPHLVAVGRLAPQKGLPVLVEALALAAPRHPGLRLTLVGDGPMRVALTSALAARGIADRVTLAGWRDGAGVRAALEGAQALVLPSFAEGLPVVAMEAMAAGRPVLATAIAGLPELVEQGVNGWLVPAGDAAALAEGIDRMAALPPEALDTMGLAGRARVMERHDVTQSAALLIRLFAEAQRR